MEPADERRGSIGELLGRVTSDLSTLMQQEIALAKAEAKATATNAGKGIGMLVGAALAGYFFLLFGSIAIWWALGDVIGRGWSALVVAVVWALIAAVLASMGRKELKQAQGIPQTTETLKKVPNAIKGHEEDNR